MRYLRLACAVALVLASAGLARAQRDQERWVEVTGEASVSAPPDFAKVTLGVTTAGKDARQAMAENAKAVNELIAAVKAEGVAPKDIQTAGLSISPTFSNNASQGSPKPPTITGYNVNDSVTLTARDLSRLGPLIDKAADAGANAMVGITFAENDPSALLDKARPLAVADARRKADIYANAGGAKIGRLMQLTEQVGAQPMLLGKRAYAPNMAAAPTPIETGEDRLTVTVTARFELTD